MGSVRSRPARPVVQQGGANSAAVGAKKEAGHCSELASAFNSVRGAGLTVALPCPELVGVLAQRPLAGIGLEKSGLLAIRFRDFSLGAQLRDFGAPVGRGKQRRVGRRVD